MILDDNTNDKNIKKQDKRSNKQKLQDNKKAYDKAQINLLKLNQQLYTKINGYRISIDYLYNNMPLNSRDALINDKEEINAYIMRNSTQHKIHLKAYIDSLLMGQDIIKQKQSNILQYENNNFQQRDLTITSNQLYGASDLTNVKIQNYKYIIGQKWIQWKQMKDKIQKQIQQFRAIIKIQSQVKRATVLKKIFGVFGIGPGQKQSQLVPIVQRDILKLLEQSYFLTQNWHDAQNKDQNSMRIICLQDLYPNMLQNPQNISNFPNTISTINPLDPSKYFKNFTNLYIYFQEYPISHNPILRPLNQFSRMRLTGKLLIAYYASKNKQAARKLNSMYQQTTKSALTNKLILQNKNKKIIAPVKQIVFPKRDQIYSIYSNKLLIDNFINQWRNLAQKKKQRYTWVAYIQPIAIHIPKTVYLSTIQLDIIFQGKVDKQRFSYAGQNNNSFIFNADQKRTYEYEIKKSDKNEDKTISFIARMIDDKGVQKIFKNRMHLPRIQNQQLGFAYDFALIPQDTSIIKPFQGDFPFVLMCQAATKRGFLNQCPEDLSKFRSLQLLSKLGKIPNLYSTNYQYNYTPDDHQIMSQIFNKIPTALNKYNFQRTYLQFAHFCQKQQNKSQNYCHFLKLNGYRTGETTGFVKQDRYQMYLRFLSPTYQKVLRDYTQFIKPYRQKISVPKQIVNKYMQNIINDIKEVSQKAQIFQTNGIKIMIQKFIAYQHKKKLYEQNNQRIAQNQNIYENQNQNGNFINQSQSQISQSQINSNQIPNQNRYQRPKRRIHYNSSMINIANKILSIYHFRLTPLSQIQDWDQICVFFITFMQALYPYHWNKDALQQDLIHLRYVVQKRIPQFNYQLNKQQYGLENFASEHLINFFSNLPLEFCYRIWDNMVANTTKIQQTRLSSVYTLMLFQQKSKLKPIYPINQIISSININTQRIPLDSVTFYNVAKVIEGFNAGRRLRQQKIAQLSKQQYLRRFAFGQNTKFNIIDQNDLHSNQRQQAVRPVNISVQNRLKSVAQLQYPLPTPGYNGYKIDKICIYVGGVFLMGNINIHSKNYVLQVNLSGGSQIIDFPLKQKSEYINKFKQISFIQHQGGNVSKKGLTIQFRLIQFQQQYGKTSSNIKQNQNNNIQIMNAKLRLNGYHKDVVYRQNVTLQSNKKLPGKLNNLGSSIINLALIIKSTNNSKNQHQNIDKISELQTQYSQKLLDYDLSIANNESVKAMNKLDKHMSKVMNPLDQLDIQKYLNLKVSTSFQPKQAEWIKNSKVTIQQLKAVFGFIFTDESQKHIRLNFPKFYENYAQNYQKFELGRFLFQLILMSPMTKLKKLSMIFCICVHYQNIYQNGLTQKMSIQTLNSLVQQLMKSTGYLNACPYVKDYFGSIKYGCYYLSGNKVESNKVQITQILRDWAYISQIKSKYNGIILGTATNLELLRSMLPTHIIQQIQRSLQCRFEIQYQIEQQSYMWSTTVNSIDFSIVSRGVKFLNNFPKYAANSQYLTSVGEVLYNCQNLIPLQSHRPIDYEQFLKIFKKNALLDYLLSQNQFYTDSIKSKERSQSIPYTFLLPNNRESGSITSTKRLSFQGKQPDQQFPDFAIYRYQNSISKWRRCRTLQDDGTNLILVKFQGKQGQYLVPRYELISMGQSDLNLKSHFEPSESEFTEQLNRA